MTEEALVGEVSPAGAATRRPGERSRSTRGAALTGVALMFGAVVTAAALVAGTLDVGADARTLQTTLEAAGAVVAFLGAYAVYVRYRLRSSSDDLLLCAALGLLGAAGLTLAVPSESRAAVPAVRFVVWTPLCLGLLAGVLLAAAALVPPRRLRRVRLALASVAVAAAVCAIAVEVGVWQFGSSLPLPARGAAAPTVAGLDLVGPPALLASDVALALLLALAVFGFAARDDDLAGWLAAGCTLLAFAPLDHAVLAASYESWIYGDDVLRLAAFALVVLGVARENDRRRREGARAAVQAERRRFAWALHDELTQDVASIALQARSALVADDPRPWLEEIAATAERTLAASRSAISILSSTNPPLDEMLVVVAQEAAARAGLRATVVVEPGCEPDAWAAEALVRVVRESIRNAARHGSATEVDVHVIRDHRVQLVARDNGSGFDPDRARARGTGFGLASIREQVEGLGGTFTLVSAPGQGTIVEAVFPCSPES